MAPFKVTTRCVHSRPACASDTTLIHCTRRDPQESEDTGDTDEEFDIGGENVGGGHFSLTTNFLPHAIKHYIAQLIYGGHHAFYDTALSEYTHKIVIRWAGSRVRKRDANTTHTDMLRLVWENNVLRAIGAKAPSSPAKVGPRERGRQPRHPGVPAPVKGCRTDSPPRICAPSSADYMGGGLQLRRLRVYNWA